MSKTEDKFEQIRFAALAVDAVCLRVNDGTLEVLLGKVVSPTKYNGMMAYIGGLIHVEETAEQAVDRLLLSKAGIRHIYKEQLYTFSKVDRDPRGRVVSVSYLVFVNQSDEQDLTKASVETLWNKTDKLPKLGYDHDEITKVAIERLRSKIMYTDIAKHFMAEEFTLSDLQKVYEAVLGEGIDKRNFRKRILSLNILKDTKKKIKKGVMRPAILYRFK